MKNNRLIIYIAIILCCVFSMFSCNDFLYMDESLFDIPPGKGALSLNITENSRTVIPGTVDVLKSYTLTFKRTDGETVQPEPMNVTDSELNNPIYLDVGTYTLSVAGYTDTEWTKPAAQGNSNGQIAITSQTPVSCTVFMLWYDPEEGGEGSFNWTITLPNELTEATMKIEPISADAAQEKTYYFKEEKILDTDILASDSIDGLNAGYYQLTFTLKKENHNDIVWLETLHIYKNMTSNFTHTFSDEDFNKVIYTVTFNNNNPSGTSYQTRGHGNKAADPNIMYPGYHLVGWFNNAGFSGAAWDFNNDAVMSDIELFAYWEQITFSGPAQIIKPAERGGWFTIGSVLTVDTSDLDFNYPAAGNFEYQWKRDGADIGTNSASYTVVGADAGHIITCVVTHESALGSVTASAESYTSRNEKTGIVPFNLVLTKNNLNEDQDDISAPDLVSFVNPYIETTANESAALFNGDNAAIYYKLMNTHNYNTFLLQAGGVTILNITKSKTDGAYFEDSFTYTVNSAHASSGTIIIRAESAHSEGTPLDSPANVEFAKDGTIRFKPGANNPAISTYTVTLYLNDNNIEEQGIDDELLNTTLDGDYIKANIKDNDSNIINKMLNPENNPDKVWSYTVRIQAHTTDENFAPSSFWSEPSNAVIVRQIEINLTGNLSGEKVTVNTEGYASPREYTANGVAYAFDGNNVELTATVNTGRKVTWTGGSASGTNAAVNTITSISANTNITAVFSAATELVASDFNDIALTRQYTASAQPVAVNYDNSIRTKDATTAGSISVLYKVKGTADSTYTATPPINAGTYEIAVSTTGGTVYVPALNLKAGELVITPITLTWGSNGVANTKVYDGTLAATVNTDPTLAGIIAGDTTVVTVTRGTVSFVNANAGTQGVTATGFGITSTPPNYLAPISQPAFNNAVISKAPGKLPSEITASSVTDKTITVNAVTVSGNDQGITYGYSVLNNGTGIIWQTSSPTLTGLIPETEYYIYARSEEGTNHLQGVWGDGTTTGGIRVSAGITTEVEIISGTGSFTINFEVSQDSSIKWFITNNNTPTDTITINRTLASQVIALTGVTGSVHWEFETRDGIKSGTGNVPLTINPSALFTQLDVGPTQLYIKVTVGTVDYETTIPVIITN